jgi:hypothetical protein
MTHDDLPIDITVNGDRGVLPQKASANHVVKVDGLEMDTPMRLLQNDRPM